jgi:CubicO group peptidase (beta-lactamase class C family)
LVARGKLKFDSKISEFIPDFPNGDRITILQLLDYTSGIKHTNDLGWISMKEPLLLSEIIDGLAKEPLDFDPGTARNYSNGAYAVAAAVIESRA